MHKFEIEVEKETGPCTCNYKAGDKFYAEGLNTPDKEFCGGAFLILYPIQTALSCGARFDFEENPKSKTKLACPDNGYVTFRITMLDQDMEQV